MPKLFTYANRHGQTFFDGDVIDINQTVNGQSEFVVCITKDEVYLVYAHDVSRLYEYDVWDLLNDEDIKLIKNIYH